MINCSSTTRGQATMDGQSHSGAWNRRLQGKKLQNKSDKDQTQITMIKRHIQAAPIPVEEYLRNKMLKMTEHQQKTIAWVTSITINF